MTPGHTPGHQSILVNLPNTGPLFFAADSCYTEENIANDVLPGLMWSAGETVKSVQRMKNLQDMCGATIVTGHDPEGWKQYKQAPEYYDLWFQNSVGFINFNQLQNGICYTLPFFTYCYQKHLLSCVCSR